MKKYFFILIYFFINFNIFSLEFSNYSLDGDKILDVDNYKDFLIIYTETKEEIYGNTVWNNFVYFFKKENNKFILYGYLSVNKAGKDIFEDTKEIIERSFYKRNISSFSEYLSQEFPEGNKKGKGIYSKTEWEIRYDDNYNVSYLWW